VLTMVRDDGRVTVGREPVTEKRAIGGKKWGVVCSLEASRDDAGRRRAARDAR
jgi:hypothetical protein